MKLNCLIVDDEAVARRGIAQYAGQTGFLEVVAAHENAVQANQTLLEKPIDLIFLDIQMPKLTGLDFLNSLSSPPMAIVISAYPEYALRGFELDVIDYIVKPFSFERFLKACNKALEYFQMKKRTLPNSNFFFIKADNRIEKIEIDKIIFIEAVGNYTNIYTTTKKYMTLLSLKSLEDELASHPFLKVHRSYLIAKDKAEGIEGNEIVMAGYRVPISRHLRETVLASILNGKYLKR